MTTDARTKIQQQAAEAAEALRNVRIDLEAFLELAPAERAARWRQWDLTSKEDVVIQQLNRMGATWTAAIVDQWVAKYDAKWSAAEASSDIALPASADLLVVVKERRDQAERHGDAAGVRQLDRVRVNVLNGTRLRWTLGDLLVQSASNAGMVYSVTRRGCTCPNGAAGRSACWHVALYDILIDMLEERAATADLAAEAAADPPDEPNPLGDEPGDEPPTDWRAKLDQRLAETAAILEAMRDQQRRASAVQLGRRLAAARSAYLAAA